MKLSLLMVMLLVVRAVCAPSLFLGPQGFAANLAAMTCERVVIGTSEQSGEQFGEQLAGKLACGQDAQEMAPSCCDGACLCCISEPSKKAPAEPVAPGSGEGPLRGVLAAADVGEPVVPGPAIVTPRVMWPRECRDAASERRVARDAAAILCVWRT